QFCESTGQMSLFSRMSEPLRRKLWPTPQAFDATDIRRSPEALARAKKNGGCANLREVVLTSSAEASPVRTSARPARVPGSMGSVPDYGGSTPVLLAKYDRDSSSWRTSQL